jgi:hypothetical protein
MRFLRRSALLAGSLGLVVTTAVALTPTVAGATTSASVSSVTVHGRLLVVPSERPGGHASYGVALADGDIVQVRGHFAPDARTGAIFDGRLGLPASVTDVLARRGTVGDPRQAALRLVDRRSLTLSVVGAPSVAEVAPAVTPTSHRQFVAAIDNRGSLTQTDAQLLGHVSTVGGYWQDESNGAISSLIVPATVKRYDTGITTTTDCGLGDGFFDVIQEAEARFPAFNPGAGDQLVLFVPPSCPSGGIVGEGTIGSSFASGGELIVKAGTAIDGTYAHETGHNYGFQHANARWSGTSMEYYGIYDVMGFALDGVNQLTALSTPFRVYQGITDPGEIQDVDLGDKTQPVHVTETIKPRSADVGLRSLSVVDPDTGERLYLDDRSGTGKDVGSAYAAGVGLQSGNGVLRYAAGVVITAAHATSGVDDLVLDASGHTSLGAGGTWTNASGTLSVHVTSVGSAGADVSVDFSPPQDFTTAATPVIGGDVSVGGAVTLDLGTWNPTPTTTTIRWTADGSPVPNTNDKTTFVPAAALVGKHLVATVTGSRLGFRTATVPSAAVTVSAGTIPVTAAPTITGTPQVGFVLHAHAATWGTTLSTVTGTWQWRADGVDIPGATAADYTVQAGDVGKAITLAERLTATGYQTVTPESLPTTAVPAPVISPAPTPTVSGTPMVGAPLTVTSGTWMTGVTLSYQWSVGGSPVAGATGTSYTPQAGDLGQTVTVTVTGTKLGYPDVTSTSADTAAVGLGVLTSTKPAIGGSALVAKRLTAEPGAWTSGTTFGYAWFADGVAIKNATAKKLLLTRAQRGKRITVRVTGSHPGYASRTLTSAKTAKVT